MRPLLGFIRSLATNWPKRAPPVGHKWYYLDAQPFPNHRIHVVRITLIELIACICIKCLEWISQAKIVNSYYRCDAVNFAKPIVRFMFSKPKFNFFRFTPSYLFQTWFQLSPLLWSGDLCPIWALLRADRRLVIRHAHPFSLNDLCATTHTQHYR